MNYFALSWAVSDYNKSIRITSTGVNETNERFVITIDGFVPHIFIAPKQYTPADNKYIIKHYKKLINKLVDINRFGLNETDFRIVKRGYKISNGYSFNRLFPVLQIEAQTLNAYRRLIRSLHPANGSESRIGLTYNAKHEGKLLNVIYDVYNEYKNKEEMLFIQEHNLNAAGWNRIDKDNAIINTIESKLFKTTFVRLRKPTMITGISQETPMPEPSILICALDIEQYSCRERSSFPTVTEAKDAIFMIAVSFKRSNEAEPFKNYVIHLKNYDDVDFQMDGADVIPCNSEATLIEMYATLIRLYNPNITYGYNSLTYDIPRIVDRYTLYYTNIVNHIIEHIIPTLFVSWPDKLIEFDDSFLNHTEPATKARILRLIEQLYERAIDSVSRTNVTSKNIPKQAVFVSDEMLARLHSDDIKLDSFIAQVCESIKDAIPNRFPELPRRNETTLLKLFSQPEMPATIETPLIKVEAKVVKGVMTVETQMNLMVDVYYIVRAEALFFEEKLSSLTLDNVSEKILGDHKEDMPYDEMFKYYEKPTAKKYKEMSIYCLKDATLCHDLFDSFNTLTKSSSLATLCYINLRDIFYSGQTRKVESVVKKKSLEMSNTLVKYQTPADNIAKYKYRVKYDGAFVFEPEPGIYSHISCLDFASLYPSLIISKNISPDAIIGYYMYYVDGSKDLVRKATKGKHMEFDAGNHGYYTDDNKFRFRRLAFNSFAEPLARAERILVDKRFYVPEHMLTDGSINPNMINHETVHLSRYRMVYDEVEDKEVMANRNKSNFKGFYEMKAFFISDVGAPENTGVLSTVSQYLLTERRAVKKRLWAPHKRMEAAKEELFKYIVHLPQDEIDNITYAFNSGSLLKVYKIVKLYNAVSEMLEIIQKFIRAKKEYNNVDAQQLAIKLVGNSTYGLTGATTSPFYEVALAGSITAAGRKATLSIAELVPQWYKGAKIRYGDTDSIMIEFIKLPTASTTHENREWIKKMSEECSIKINDYFEGILNKKTLIIEFEKIISPFIVTKKKRYIGMYYESSMETPDKKIKNGTILKKRNYGLFAKTLYEEVTDILIEGGDIKDAFKRIGKILLERITQFQTMSPTLPLEMYVRSMRFPDMNDISTKAKVAAVFYFNEMVPKSRRSKFDLGGRIQYFSVHRPLYFNRNIQLINDSKSYFIKSADEVYALCKDDEEAVRKNINPFIHLQSEVRGPVFNQLLMMLGFNAHEISRQMIEFIYDGRDKSIAKSFFISRIKTTVKLWLGENKIPKTDMYIKVLTCNTFDPANPIGIREIRGVRKVPELVDFYFIRRPRPLDWQRYTWSDAEKMYVDKKLEYESNT